MAEEKRAIEVRPVKKHKKGIHVVCIGRGERVLLDRCVKLEGFHMKYPGVYLCRNHLPLFQLECGCTYVKNFFEKLEYESECLACGVPVCSMCSKDYGKHPGYPRPVCLDCVCDNNVYVMECTNECVGVWESRDEPELWQCSTCETVKCPFCEKDNGVGRCDLCVEADE